MYADSLTSLTGTSSTATLKWDAENRLIEVLDGSTSKVSYAYDYLGRRISRSVGTTTNNYLYDGWNLIAEYTGSTAKKVYMWGMDLSGSMQGAGGVGGLLSVSALDTGGTVIAAHYPAYDGNGNVTEYLKGTDGTAEVHFEYDPFGRLIANTDTAGDFPIRFSTKIQEDQTGLYYYGYRYYDPVTGRWPSRDPIEERGGVNLYGFGSNSPTSGFDYLGWDFRDVDPISGGRVPPDNRVPTLIPPRKGGLPRPVEPVTPDPTIPPDYDLPDELDGPGKGGKGTRRKAVGEVALDVIDAAGAFLTAHKARSWCDDAHAASGERCGCCYINIRYFRKLQGGVTAPRVYELFASTYYGGKSCTTRRNDRAMNEGETADQGPDNSWFPEVIRLDQSTIAERGMLTEERTYPR